MYWNFQILKVSYNPVLQAIGVIKSKWVDVYSDAEIN